jgi:hypothetical protein
MIDFENHVSFEPFAERRWPVWRAKVRTRQSWFAPGQPEGGYVRVVDLGWYWRWTKARALAAAYRDSAERISRLAGHIVEQPGGYLLAKEKR